MSTLPVAERWYETTVVDDTLTLILEPYVDRLEQANMWLVRGRDADLLIDQGMGIVPMKPLIDALAPGRPVIALATHTHVDHVGATHEFAERWVHRIEADDLRHPKGVSTLISAEIDPVLRQCFVESGYEPLGEYLITALPHAGYDIASYRRIGCEPTRILEEGDIVDLGDRQFEVLLVPGHSPGSIGLFEAETGIFFAGDVIYDGPLVDNVPGADLDVYAATLKRLMQLPVSIVHAGHDPSFGRERLVEICETYLRKWDRG